MILRAYLGDFGHFTIITAFIAALISAYCFFKLTQKPSLNHWRRLSVAFFAVHTVAVVATLVIIFTIIFNHYYEYQYVWQHSANALETQFLVSCLWEGQEGSFLLWLFWQALAGWLVFLYGEQYKNQSMVFVCLAQWLLTSMILGIEMLGVKIGSSPFLLLREAVSMPIFQTDPDYIPTDGSGLNPLLQNYWMVIHPPTLFLGFALCVIPFSLAMASLWKKEFTKWLSLALPWTILATCILGIGITMGSYWAYETLNFGGYWSWDPVENAVYIPWLVLVVSLHLIFLNKNKSSSLKITYVSIILAFVLILYSTFLTRSGVLGDTSVHSFTDLGLSGQLVFLMAFFVGLSLILLINRWNAIPSRYEKLSIFQKDLWLFLGTSTLALAAFQVLFHTSIPVYNVLFSLVGLELKMAPTTDPDVFYSQWQLFFAIFIAIFSGTGHIIWWRRLSKELIPPILIPTLAFTTLIIILSPLDDWKYILLLTCCVYSIISNLTLLIFLFKRNYRLIGGGMSHIGLAIMLVGVIFSAGYAKIISNNTSGLIYRKDFSDEMNKKNLLLFRGEEKKMKGNTLVYKGAYLSSPQANFFIPKEVLFSTQNPQIQLSKRDIYYRNEKMFSVGDTVEIIPENVFYRIDYYDADSTKTVLYPRLQFNEQMGIVISPSISHYVDRDIYTHITAIPEPEKEQEAWSPPEEFHINLKDTFFVNDYVAILKNISIKNKLVGIDLLKDDFALQAEVEVLDKDKSHYLTPTYVIKDNQVGFVPEISQELGVKILLIKIDVQAKLFSFAVQTRQKDWVIIKSIEMPYIVLVWLGCLLMFSGMSFAFVRRLKEHYSRSA